VIGCLLKPVNWLYGKITDVRNFLYDSAVNDVMHPDVYTIGVGNLTVGGTGKTPHVDYIVSQLKKQNSVAVLSRGYGRRTRGFRIATDADTADTIGDEPLLLYRKHATGPAPVTVCVGEKRAEAITQLLSNKSAIQAIVLDDAFQHRAVRPHLNILLTDYNRPFYEDAPFPGGRLRERRHGARRADVIVVTKCPDALSQADQSAIEARIEPYKRPDVPLYFTGLRYGEPVAFAANSRSMAQPKPVVLVSGIARPEPLEQYVGSQFTLSRHLRFADHHRYTAADLERIRTAVPAGGVVLTTEKDFVKLAPLLRETGTDASAFYYLPIEISFLKNEDQFKALLAAGVKKSQKQTSPINKSTQS
jgi:tetraacyldisaccharide 4'-kinase